MSWKGSDFMEIIISKLKDEFKSKDYTDNRSKFAYTIGTLKALSDDLTSLEVIEIINKVFFDEI